MKKCFASALAVLALLVVGCQNPNFTGPSKAVPGTVTVTMRNPARTLVANWQALVTSYDVTLTSNETNPPLTTSVSPAGAGSVVFSNVPTGTWNVTVVAKNSQGVEVGTGAAVNQTLNTGDSLSVAITVNGTQTGSGGYIFTFNFPSTSADSVVGQLYAFPGNSPVGNGQTAALSAPSAQTSQGVLAQNGLPSGTYYLTLKFYRGGTLGTLAGTFGEAVNIYDNLISDQWLDGNGNLNPLRVFSSADFNSPDSTLASLTWTTTGTVTLNPAFVPGTTSYTAVTTASATFTAGPNSGGQLVQTQLFTAGGWAAAVPGLNLTVSNAAGGARVAFLVTSSDQLSTTKYQLTVNPLSVVYHTTVGATGTPPSDPTAYVMGDQATVSAGSTLSYPNFNFAGWMTAPDGTGNNYNPGDKITLGTNNVDLYPIWVPDSLTFTLVGTVLTITGVTATGPSLAANLTIPPGVSAIGAGAFANQTVLTSVTVPASVTTIGDTAFNGASNLTDIDFQSVLPPVFAPGVVAPAVFSVTGLHIHVPAANLVSVYTTVPYIQNSGFTVTSP